MESGVPALADAVAHGVDLARVAWRRLWAIQAVSALGVALVFVALRGSLPMIDAGDAARLGAVLTLVAAAPLWGGLYRLAAGPYGRGGLGLAGLRFGSDELRLIGLALAFLAAAVLGWLPLVFLSALIFVVFHDAGQVMLGPLGGVQVSFLLVAAAWLAALALFVYACARLATAPAASVAERRLVVIEAWAAGRGRVGRTLTAWVLAQGPALLVAAALGAIDSLHLAEMVVGAGLRWPLVDAWAAGLVLGATTAFLQVPMTVGALSRLWQAPAPEAFPASALRRVLKPELSPG
jgi:hypothetical protein